MHLTLFVPDLLWPDVEDAHAFDFPGANNLARLLSLGTAIRTPLSPTDSWESRLAVLFGFPGIDAPLASIRCLGSELPANGLRLCADPVNLDFMQQALVLSPISVNTLSAPEVSALLDSLNQEFAQEGQFIAAPGASGSCQWTFIPFEPAPDLGTEHEALPNLPACSRLAGRRVDADETRALLGRDGLRWINRIQMCLNDHPVNLSRELAGLPRINSLWPWGRGQLSTLPEKRFTEAHGVSTLLNGLCQATQTLVAPCNEYPHGAGHHLMCSLELSEAISHDDLTAWQTAIGTLTQDWISPALAALANPKGAPAPLQSLTLISPNAHHEHRWTLTRQSKGLHSNWLQRWLGTTAKSPSLHSLIRTWST